MKTLKHITLLAAALFFAATTCAQPIRLGTSNTYYELTGIAPNLTLNITGTGDMPDYANAGAAPWRSQRADIKTVVIENGVTSISGYAFAFCTGLNSVDIPGSVGSIGTGAFELSGLTSVDIPSSVTTMGVVVFAGCIGLTAINVNAANPKYLSENGVLFNKDTTTLICCPAGKTGAYAIPNGVDSIGYGAFFGCGGLTGALTIPDGVTYIGYNAFAYCSGFTGALTIPSSVTVIGEGAFWYCTGFTAIYNYCIAPLNIVYGIYDVLYDTDKSTCAL
ncbi:MAG: leucine-rich repeat domain-containing protein, partial [Paludibacter sp.]|nr:leucine-rich repeat domain-containing protein [Paludibacter sp.]